MVSVVTVSPVLAGVGFDWVPVIWFFVIWAVLIVSVFYILQWNRNRLENPQPLKKITTITGSRKITDPAGQNLSTQTTVEAKRPTTTHKKVEAKVTEKTREEMFEMISQVKSLTQEISRPDFSQLDPNDEELKKLQESELVKNLADTMISEVHTEGPDNKKFSKMMLDASLFFDESDQAFFEKEFGKSK